MADIQVCVTWKGMGLVVTIEDYDYYYPDEFIPTSGYVEIDYFDNMYTTLLKQIQAQIDDEPDRFFERIVSECEDEIYEKGIEAHEQNIIDNAMDAYANYKTHTSRRW